MKRSLILSTLRREILEGTFEPGEQLPARTELIRRFKAGAVTVQQAVDRLIADGYLTSRDRSGTFVAECPPHLFQYGIGFPSSPASPNWAHYWTAMANAARGFSDRFDRRFRFYHNIAPDRNGSAFPEMLDDVRNHRLAGLIFPSFPHELSGTEIIDNDTLPRVAVHLGPAPGFGTIGMDNLSMYDRALNYLADRGHRDIAVLALAVLSDEQLDYVTSGITARGMRTRPYWVQRQPYAPATCVAQVCHLMMRPGQTDYPDALFILDDNLVPMATAGLLEAGVREESPLETVSHCNFPWSLPSHLPTKRIGFDIRKVVAAGIRIIDRQRLGQPAESVTLTAQFDHEVEDDVVLDDIHRSVS